jgi:hypothetical protein
MKIEDSTLKLSSVREAVRQRRQQGLNDTDIGDVHIKDSSAETSKQRADGDVVHLSGDTSQKVSASEVTQPRELDRTEQSEKSSENSPDASAEEGIHTLKVLLEQKTGRKVEITNPDKLKESNENTESATFSAEGIIKTKDGETVEFESRLNMSHRRVEVDSFEIKAGSNELLNPLILNFDGTASDMLPHEAEFDVDDIKNGIDVVEPGSEFLAIDREDTNRSGDDEKLFGAITGKSFDELAKIDSDGDGWIDKNENKYEDLKAMRLAQGGEARESLNNLDTARDVFSPDSSDN